MIGRITLFLECGNYGWTETSINDVPDGLNKYTILFSNANFLAQKRKKLIPAATGGHGCRIIGYRVSDNAAYRDSYIQAYQPEEQGTFTGTVLHPTTALLCRLTGDQFHRRPLYLRGLPDAIIDGDGKYSPSPAWLAAINDYRKTLTNGNWYVLGRFAPFTANRNPVLGIIPPNSWSFKNNVTGAAGDLYRIGGRGRYPNYPRGLFKLSADPIGKIASFSGVDLPQDFGYVPNDLYGEPYVPQTAPITEFADERLTERRTGRPLGLPRGRRALARR